MGEKHRQMRKNAKASHEEEDQPDLENPPMVPLPAVMNPARDPTLGRHRSIIRIEVADAFDVMNLDTTDAIATKMTDYESLWFWFAVALFTVGMVLSISMMFFGKCGGHQLNELERPGLGLS